MSKRDPQEVAVAARELMLAIERDEHGNPLTLEGAIRSMILKSPNYCQHRDDALDTLFCVLGAGLDWEAGRIVDTHPNNYMNMPPDTHYGPWSTMGETEARADLLSGLSEETATLLREQFESDDLKIWQGTVETIENIDERCATYREGKRYWYPIGWYASRLCAPENALPDWLDGAIETASLIAALEPPLVVAAGCIKYATRLETRRFAKRILPALLERRDILGAS